MITYPHNANELPTAVKDEARRLLTYAVQTGAIQKPDACALCGSVGDVEGHHTDYSKPLVVVWLCEPCHNAQHPTRRQDVGLRKPRNMRRDKNGQYAARQWEDG